MQGHSVYLFLLGWVLTVCVSWNLSILFLHCGTYWHEQFIIFSHPCQVEYFPLIPDTDNLGLISLFPHQSFETFINLVDLLQQPTFGVTDFSLLFICHLDYWFLFLSFLFPSFCLIWVSFALPLLVCKLGKITDKNATSVLYGKHSPGCHLPRTLLCYTHMLCSRTKHIPSQGRQNFL